MSHDAVKRGRGDKRGPQPGAALAPAQAGEPGTFHAVKGSPGRRGGAAVGLRVTFGDGGRALQPRPVVGVSSASRSRGRAGDPGAASTNGAGRRSRVDPEDEREARDGDPYGSAGRRGQRLGWAATARGPRSAAPRGAAERGGGRQGGEAAYVS